MRKMKVKSPEKETATTASEEDQESSLRGVPSAGTGGGDAGSGDGPGGPGGGPCPAWGLWMHPGGGAGGGTARRLPALLSPQLGATRGRGAHGGGQGRDPMRGTHTVTMTPHAPAWGSQVPPCLPKPPLLLAPTAPHALPGSIRGQTAPGKPQPHLPKPHTNPRPHPMGHGDAPRAPPGTETPNPSLPPHGAQPPPRPLSCQPSVRPRPGSCHITILPRASRTTGGLWQEEAKKPQRGAAAAPPSASPCPRAVPSPTPKPSSL